MTPVLDQWFDGTSLSALRASTQASAAHAGMPADRATDIVIALHELAANAVRHGAGSGRLWIWEQAGALYCRVDDDGPAVSLREREGTGTGGAVGPNLADRWPCEPGHGLWLARQVADQLTLRSDTRGTRALITFSMTERQDAAWHRDRRHGAHR